MPTKRRKKVTQPASQLLQDNDGHWYLIPEIQVSKFETLLGIAEDELGTMFQPFMAYAIDGPHRLRILAWEEI